MQHSVKFIAKVYSELSEKRQDEKRFIEDDFIRFAFENKTKYSLIDGSDGDLLVSTWYSGELVKDYQNTL
jgi:hypothetical protein